MKYPNPRPAKRKQYLSLKLACCLTSVIFLHPVNKLKCYIVFQRVKELEEEKENLQEKIQALEASAVSDIKCILKGAKLFIVSFAAVVWARHATLRDEPKQRLRRRLSYLLRILSNSVCILIYYELLTSIWQSNSLTGKVTAPKETKLILKYYKLHFRTN